MRSFYKVILYLLLIATPVLTQQPARQKFSAREVAQRTLPSVVLLVMSNTSADGVSLGSGFFVAPDLVVTNFHVIEGSLSGLARINGLQDKYEVAGFVALDRERDLALVKLKGATGKPLVIGDASAVAIGDEIFAAGNPLGLEGTFSQGIVSSIRRMDNDSLIQITAPLSPGSSGGPVLDQQGKVIGVAVGSIVDGQALNFAIPSSYLRALLANRKPLISFAEALKDSVAEAAPGRSIPGGVPGGVASLGTNRRNAPSLTTEEAYERRMPSLPVDLRAITRITLTKDMGRPARPQTLVFTPADGRIKTQVEDRNRDGVPDYLRIWFDGQNNHLGFEFATFGLGRNLSPGTYTRCQRAAFSEGTAGLDISGNGAGCNELTGMFSLYEVQYDYSKGSPVLTSFAVSFEQQCYKQTTTGVIYINAVPIDGVR